MLRTPGWATALVVTIIAGVVVWWLTSSLTPESNDGPSITSFEPDIRDPQAPGACVTWFAKAKDPDDDQIYYNFSLKGPSTNNTWKNMQSWSTQNGWDWLPVIEGDYRIQVCVKDRKNSDIDDFKIGTYIIQNYTNQPPLLTSLEPDTVSPIPFVKVIIKWTAEANDPDGDQVYYKFWLRGPLTGGNWIQTQNWSTQQYWDWIPGEPGDYQVKVDIIDRKHACYNGTDDSRVAVYRVINDRIVDVEPEPNTAEVKPELNTTEIEPEPNTTEIELEPNTTEIELEPEESDLYIIVGSDGCDYFSIQEAIDAAHAGDIIYLTDGFFSENLIIDKSLILEGAGAGKTVVSGEGAGSVFRIGENIHPISVTLSGITIQGGSNYIYGGGIFNAADYLLVKDCEIVYNSAGGGAGIGNYRGVLEILGCNIFNNFASANGGGVHNYDSSGTITITGTEIFNNSADGCGGGIVNGGEMTLENDTISGNVARYDGGGIYTGNEVDDNTIIVKNSTLSENEAGWSGGGIWNCDKVIVTDTAITENTAANGGGIYSRHDGTATVSNGYFFGNNPNDVYPELSPSVSAYSVFA